MQAQEAFCRIENCIMSDETPSKKLSVVAGEPWFALFPFSMLLEQRKTQQSPIHHPEGNVWKHTLMVVDEAAKRRQYSTDPKVFMWAALLHDIGKPATTKIRKGKITAYDHDRHGAKLAGQFLSALTDESEFTKSVMWLVRYHMQILYVNKSLPFQDIAGMQEHTRIGDVALLSYCDRLGRGGADPDVERENVLRFLKKCHESIDVPWL